MPKQAPTFGRIAAMVVFALSCFGLLTFLWISFGGPTPLKPEKYRFKAQFAEAALLVPEADVRMSGLTIGKVKELELRKQGGVLAELEIDREFAPLPLDSLAMLRQKTLLGQIYVELTPGSPSAPKLPEGEQLDRAQVEDTVELDEIVRTFDPTTRRHFRGWVGELARAIKGGTGESLNDAYGTLPAFTEEGGNLFDQLDAQEPALHRLIRNTGIALGALNQREGQLRELIVNANDFFGALASRNDALAETFQIFPTFLDESRATVDRLREFAIDTRPLVRDLTPVAEQLQPTLRDVGRLAPDLQQLFRDLDVLITESERTLPHAARFLRGAKPLLESLHAYLPELNPILSFANFEQQQLADFIKNGAGSLTAALPGVEGEGPRHYLRQFSITSSRGVGVAQTRPEYERANAYPAPNYLKRARVFGISESFDCKPTRGVKRDPTNGSPPCFVQPPSLFDLKHFPRLVRGGAPLRPPPNENEGTRTGRPGRGPAVLPAPEPTAPGAGGGGGGGG